MARNIINLLSIHDLCSMVMSEKIVFPSFHRGFVWSNNQVKSLLESIYHDYPIGMILVLEDKVDRFVINPIQKPLQNASGVLDKLSYRWFIIDGSQRIYALYNCFFGLDEKIDFSFSLENEEFIPTSKVTGSETFINLRALYSPEKFFEFQKSLFTSQMDETLLEKARKLHEIFINYQLPVQIIREKSNEEILEIFRVYNTVGRILSKSDFEAAVKDS